jgi:hypothetical protein
MTEQRNCSKENFCAAAKAVFLCFAIKIYIRAAAARSGSRLLLEWHTERELDAITRKSTDISLF